MRLCCHGSLKSPLCSCVSITFQQQRKRESMDSRGLHGAFCLFAGQILLPIGDHEMPPFLGLPVKTGISHCDLEQMHAQAYCRVSTSVMPYCGRRKIIKVRRHLNRAIRHIDQGCINSDSPTVQRASASLWIGDILVVVCGLPQLDLHRFRSIRIPDF